MKLNSAKELNVYKRAYKLAMRVSREAASGLVSDFGPPASDFRPEGAER